jgi:hypothetical protein
MRKNLLLVAVLSLPVGLVSPILLYLGWAWLGA